MQILQRVKRVVQLVFDGEIYSLAWLAAKNSLKPPRNSGPQIVEAKQKKAKAVNGQ